MHTFASALFEANQIFYYVNKTLCVLVYFLFPTTTFDYNLSVEVIHLIKNLGS